MGISRGVVGHPPFYLAQSTSTLSLQAASRLERNKRSIIPQVLDSRPTSAQRVSSQRSLVPAIREAAPRSEFPGRHLSSLISRARTAFARVTTRKHQKQWHCITTSSHVFPFSARASFQTEERRGTAVLGKVGYDVSSGQQLESGFSS